MYAIPTCYMARPPFLFVRVALHSPALAATIYQYSHLYTSDFFPTHVYPFQIKLPHLEYRLFELGQYMEGSSLVLYLQASENCLVQAKLLGKILLYCA